MRTNLLVAFLLGLLMAALPAIDASAQSVSVDISRIGDASHFEFSGSVEWKYEMKRQPNSTNKGDRITLRVPGLDSKASALLRGHKDQLVQKILVSEGGVDGSTEVTFNLAPGVDFFDYLTEQPSRLIVDFFPKDEPQDGASTGAAGEASKGAQGKGLPEKGLPENGKGSLASAKTKSDLSANRSNTAKRGLSASAEMAEEDDLFARDISEGITGISGARAGSQRRNPAASELDDEPSLAEKISEGREFKHGIFDGGDPEFRRFTIKDHEINPRALIASRANYYLPFPRLDLGNPQLRALVAAPPSYEIVPNDKRENKEARILVNLYNSRKQALLLKTADEFLKKYPNSPYEEIVRYLVADTHFDFWRREGPKAEADFEKAMGIYHLLTEKYPQSPVTARTLLLMAYSHMDRGDNFGALKTFQRFQRLAPNSKHLDGVRLAEAEVYVRLNRFDDASALLGKIEATSTSETARQQAAYRKGDVLFRKLEWESAIRAYTEAAKKYPDASSRFPNLAYNTAEAQFKLERYKEALESYRKFLQKFPYHDHGGYAMTRMGEILAILGADHNKSKGAFLESAFRYRNTPGAGIARIRNLTARMPQMKEKELAAALREIETVTVRYSNRPEVKKACLEEESKLLAAARAEGEAGSSQNAGEAKKEESEGQEASASAAAGGLASDSEQATVQGKYGKLLLDDVCQRPEEKTKLPIELPGIEEFSRLLIADAFSARGEHDRAVKELISYYQENPQSPNRNRLKARIVGGLSAGIRQSVEKGDFIDALRRWSKDSAGWLKNTERVDVRFDVGRAYEQAGVFKEANQFYRDVLKRVADIRAAGDEQERAIFENLPKDDQIHLRLAAVAARDQNLVLAESHLKNIVNPKSLTEPEQIERAEVSADVAEGRGQSEEARRYLSELIRAWKGDPKYTSPLHLRIARLLAKSNRKKEADSHLSKIIAMKDSGKQVSDDVHAQALELRGDLFLERGQRASAINSYRNLLAAYGNRMALESVRYRLGQILFEDGDLKGAEAEWAGLDPSKHGVWARLAQEQMQGATWRREYKKYLDRIPAAADLREAATSNTEKRSE